MALNGVSVIMLSGDFEDRLASLNQQQQDELIEDIFTKLCKRAKMAFGDAEMEPDDVEESLGDNHLSVYVAYKVLNVLSKNPENANKRFGQLIRDMKEDSLVQKYKRS